MQIDHKPFLYPELINDPMKQDPRWVDCYPAMILEGLIVAGKDVILAAERHFKDKYRAQETDWAYHLDYSKVDQWISVYGMCVHTKGELARRPIELMHWQQFWVGSLFGWVTKVPHKVTGQNTRRFRTSLLMVGRKNGKSTMCAPLALGAMLFDNEFGSEVVSAATTKEQAGIVFNDATTMLSLSPLAKIAQPFRNIIRAPSVNASYKVVAADQGKLDGLNLQMAICDELAAWKDERLYSVLDTSMGARTQPLMISITTANYILDGVATDMYDYGQQVLNGTVDNDKFFPLLYHIDDTNKWDNITELKKANPCLGISLKQEFLEEQIAKAKAIYAEKQNFLIKHANIFTSSSDTWLNVTKVKECRVEAKREDYAGRDCYIGFDAAEYSDLTSICYLFPEGDGTFTTFYDNYVPAYGFERAPERLRQQYKQLSAKGCLNVTISETMDFEIIREKINEASKLYNLKGVAYDPYHVAQICNLMENEDRLPMVAINASPANMSEASKFLEAAVFDKRFKYNDDAFEFCAAHAIAKVDDRMNIKVTRETPKSDKIDVVISTIIALCIAEVHEKAGKSVYEDRGFRVLM